MILKLRLKTYTKQIYDRYLRWSKEPTLAESMSAKGTKLKTSYAAASQTLLFFNQSAEKQKLNEWLLLTPLSYQLKIHHCLSLIEDSNRWALSSLGMGEESGVKFPDEEFVRLDLGRLRILEDPLESDALTTRFGSTCTLIHEICPPNAELRESLLRLIWAYLMAKELTAEARELALCDRLQYLRQITRL